MQWELSCKADAGGTKLSPCEATNGLGTKWASLRLLHLISCSANSNMTNRTSVCDWHHLHTHTLGLALLGSRFWLTLACGGGLECVLSHANEFGAGCADYSFMALEAQRLCHHSFESGQPIWQRNLFTLRCKDNRVSPGMSRWGNFGDNAVSESFFSCFKS